MNQHQSSEKKRRVSFQEDAKYIPSPTHYFAEDCINQWYSNEDYNEFRQTTQMIAQESRQSSCSVLLDNAFGLKSRSASAQRALNRWVHLCSRRGLEMWSSKKHGFERKSSQRQAIRAVLQDQEMQRKHFGRVDVEQLAQVSQLLTKHAKAFALKMGLADEAALTSRTPSPFRFRKPLPPLRVEQVHPSTPERKQITRKILESETGIAIAA